MYRLFLVDVQTATLRFSPWRLAFFVDLRYYEKGGDNMKDSRWKGYIAPVVITIFFAAYLVLYFGVLASLLPGIWKYALFIIPLVLVGVLLYVCIERIKEIRGGEADDLSKY